jgi:hypothetical protein
MNRSALNQLMSIVIHSGIVKRSKGLKTVEIEILAIIYKYGLMNGYCLVSDILRYMPAYGRYIYDTLDKLIGKGLVLNNGNVKFKLVITGKGHYLLKDYCKAIEMQVKEFDSLSKQAQD